MKFGQYLQALKSGDINKWVFENMTNRNDFGKFKARAILLKSFSDGECPISRFKVYRNPDELVFGQFIFIETNITSNDKYYDKLLAFARYILRPVYDKDFDNEDLDKEEEHTKNVLNEPCENVLRVVNKYMDARNEFINKKYSGVFYKAKQDEDVVEGDNKQYDNVDNKDKQWYWYSLIRTLSGNLHKHKETLMLKMSEVAPEIAYLRYIEQKEEYERKVSELKNRVKNGSY